MKCLTKSVHMICNNIHTFLCVVNVYLGHFTFIQCNTDCFAYDFLFFLPYNGTYALSLLSSWCLISVCDMSSWSELS